MGTNKRQWYSLEDVTDKYIGEKGTTSRAIFDTELEAALIGTAIKDASLIENSVTR